MAKYNYTNNGYLIGLPARDMTADEWKMYPKKLTEAALRLGLYEIEKPKPKKEVKDA